MREEIIRMAQEAGFDYDEADKEIIVGYYGTDITPQLERFAALVAAAERERCANECMSFEILDNHAYDKRAYAAIQACAAAIRAL